MIFVVRTSPIIGLFLDKGNGKEFGDLPVIRRRQTCSYQRLFVESCKHFGIDHLISFHRTVVISVPKQ